MDAHLPSEDFPALAELLPHRPPMILLDRVTAFDPAARRLTAEVTVSREAVFATPQGVPSAVALEYMAQAAAALAGLKAREKGEAPVPGFLLGTRHLTLNIDCFAVGETYGVSAACAFEDGRSAAFDCAVTDRAGGILAEATLTTYRPGDKAEFSKIIRGKGEDDGT